MTPWRELSDSDTDAGQWRTRFVAEIDDLLAGSYNGAGVDSWWRRPRSQLKGRCPGDVVAARGFTFDCPDAKAIRELASALAGPGNAT